MKAKIKKSEMTRALIQKTGLDLMRKRGFGAVTIRQICAEAGVSVGTFYVYFDSKSDLYKDMFRENDRFFSETVAKELETGPVSERIMRFVRHYAQLNIRTGQEDMKILYTTENIWFARHRPMQAVLLRIVEEGQARGELQGEKTAEEIVDMLFVFMRGCCYDWCVKKGGYDLEARMESYLGTLVDGLCVR